MSQPPASVPSSGQSPSRAPSLQDAILQLIEARSGKTICPTDAARLAGGDSWRRLLPAVRQAAVHLARSGAIAIYRHGKPVDPDRFKGVYRLGPPLPATGDAEGVPAPEGSEG
jgi:hypothetical protein